MINRMSRDLDIISALGIDLLKDLGKTLTYAQI